MQVEVKVPILSESISEASLLVWNKKEGDYVQRDEKLIELETDKVVLEITAPKEGKLAKVIKLDGSIVSSNEVIAIIDDSDVREQQSSAEVVHLPEIGKLEEQPASRTKNVESRLVGNQEQQSPAVRKLVEENDLNVESISGTGRGGRITKGDVIKFLRSDDQNDTSEQIEQSLAAQNRPEERVPMTRLRAKIAERLKQAQNTAAILTTFNEVNMKPIMDLRSQYKDSFFKKYDAKLGFMSFFTKAAVESLKNFPIINASIDGQDIIYHGYFDIGIAVSTTRGLIVPVLRDADKLSFAQIEQKITEFGVNAKEGKIDIDDLLGGNFTITNGGIFGSLLSTPILNPPQSAILGMHSIQQRPVVENGEIVIRPMMYLALSYDHRIIDGKDAVLFLVAIKQALEDPARLLLQI